MLFCVKRLKKNVNLTEKAFCTVFILSFFCLSNGEFTAVLKFLKKKKKNIVLCKFFGTFPKLVKKNAALFDEVVKEIEVYRFLDLKQAQVDSAELLITVSEERRTFYLGSVSRGITEIWV